MVFNQNFLLSGRSGGLPIIQPYLVGLADRADVAGVVVAAVALLAAAGGADPGVQFNTFKDGFNQRLNPRLNSQPENVSLNVSLTPALRCALTQALNFKCLLNGTPDSSTGNQSLVTCCVCIVLFIN